MKRLLLLFIANCIANLANAQLEISYSNTNQALARVLGGSCASITNIQFTGHPYMLGVFDDNQNNVGLTKGMLLSTGDVLDGLGANTSPSISTNLNGPGDALLSSLCGSQTYDAAILEFDFTSTIDDSVFIKYVFASEEYPEFVGSQFNDIFGFFISGPGINGQQNIALIPGTTTPVAINNVNHISFTNYYNDNAAGTFMQYDGYTTVLYAKFYAIAGNPYHLTMKIADAGDEFYDSAVFLEGYPNGANNVSGYITYQGSPASAGTVYLYKHNTDSTQAPLVATQAIAPNGFYSIADLPVGNYILKAELNQTLYPNTYPKYHTSATLWNDATIINIPCANYNGDVGLLVLNTGDGVISGEVGYDLSGMKTAEEGLPAKEVSMLLMGRTDSLIYRHTKTDSIGLYQFNDVPEGDYIILVDIPGLPMDGFRTVEITKENKELTNQDYLVESTKIRPTDVDIILPIFDVAINLIPTQDALLINLSLTETAAVTIQLFDINGRLLAQHNNSKVSKGYSTLTLNTPSLSSGLYIARVSVGDITKTLKFVKPTN